VSAACRDLLALPSLAALVLVDAGELATSSSLRRLFEGAPNAAALACYRDEGRGLADTIHEQLAAHGLRPEPDAMAYPIDRLGVDRGITMSELAKLDLYLAPAAGDRTPRPVTLEDVAAVVGDSAALGLHDLVHATALGQPAVVERVLSRLLAEGQSPIRLLRSLANHFGRLYQLACAIEAGKPVDRALDEDKGWPRIIKLRRGHYKAELRRWRAPALAALAGHLLQAEIACKTTGRPDAELCRAAALRACRVAPAP
jgi:DNA polymerase-3 subunit delta